MLWSLATIFIGGILFGTFFSKIKLPPLLGMLLVGVVLGPYTLNAIDGSVLEISAELRQLALIVILLRAGLSLNLGDLKKVGRPAILMCFVPACFEMGAMLLFAPKFLGVTLWEAAIMGSVVAAVSPAVVVPAMLKLMEKGYGTKAGIPQLILAGAAVDDVFVIVLFTSFTALAEGGSFSPLEFAKIPLSIVFGALIGTGVGLCLIWLGKFLRANNTTWVLLFLSTAFILVTAEKQFAHILPFSGLLAVMFLGIATLRRSPTLATEVAQPLSKLWGAAQILLFVLVGAAVDVQFALLAGGSAVLLVFAALLFRMLGVLVCLIKTGLNGREKLFCMVAYTPKATVQAAIGGIPLAMGLACGNTVLTVSVLSILITAPLGAAGMELLYKRCLTRNTP